MSSCHCKEEETMMEEEEEEEEEASRGSILYSILNRGAGPPRHPPHLHRCSCPSPPKLVTVRAPLSVFTAASRVLAKTFRFLKSVACFRGLPVGDQAALVLRGWAPLLLLGLVHDPLPLHTVRARSSSLLHRILTHRGRGGGEEEEGGGGDRGHPGVPESVAQEIQMFVARFRGLGLSVKEFALVKGAILFSGELKELECGDYVQALHREAQHALSEHVGEACEDKAGRLGRLRALLAALRSVDPEAVAGLFFRPVTGSGNVEEHVLAIFEQQ